MANNNGYPGRDLVAKLRGGTPAQADPTGGYSGRAIVDKINGTGAAPASETTPQHHGGGGIMGELGRAAHYAGHQLDLAGRDIKGIPGGTFDLLKPIPIAAYDLARYGPGSKQGQENLAEANKQTRGVVKGTITTVEHPGRDLFATGTLLAPALHGVGRAGVGAVEAGRAAAAGEGAADVVRAATRAPESVPRGLTMGDKETPLIPSRGGLGRLAQIVHDRIVQNALDKNEAGATGPVSARVARYGAKRVGGALDEESRIAQRSRAVPAAMLDQSAAKLSKTRGARRGEQAALELTSHQVTPQEAIDYHLAQADKGVNPGQNEAIARLYQHVAQRDLVHLDETKPVGEKVFINPEHTKLAAVDAALAHIQRRGDEILVDKGVRSPEALKTRVDAPGQIRAAGATYIKPTPSRLGVASAALKRETARLASLERRHSDALAKDAANLQTRNAAIARIAGAPTDEAGAQARLDQLDQQYETILKKFAPEVNPYSPELAKSETLGRNTMRGRMAQGKKPATGRAIEGRVGGGSARIQTVAQDVRDLAEAKLHDIINRYPENPVAQRAAQLVNERQQLRDTLNRRAEATFSGEKPPPLPGVGGKSVALDHPYRERIVTLGHAIEEQRARVERMRKTAAARVEPTGFVGGEDFRGGRGFVSDRISQKKLSRAEQSASPGRVVGAAKAPIDSKTYEGRALAQGLRPKHVTAGASQHFRQIIKFVNTDERRRASLATGSDIKRSARDILLRVPDEKAKPLTPADLQAVGKETSTVDTPEDLGTLAGLQAAHEAFRESMFRPGEFKARFAGDHASQIGMKAPDGYRWVDRGTLGSLTEPSRGEPVWIGRRMNDVNTAITAATVYFKVGHIGTRVLTNAATNIMQGSANPRQMGYAYKLWENLTPEERARALAQSGQHGFAALPHEGTNAIAHAAGKGAQFWARHADAPFRFNSLSFELRKAGWDTPEKFRAALDGLENGGHGLSASEWSKLSAAARRADREAISYDRLNDFEKRFIARAVWFYPWIKGSTLFTVRSAIEHPFKTAALGVAGVHGREQQERTLGPTPSYEAGLVSLGGGRAPLTTDFSTFSPFATSSDILDAIARPNNAAGFLNPGAGSIDELINGLNQYGGASKAPYKDALLSLAATTPEQQLAEAAAAEHQDQSRRMFRKTKGGTLLRYLVGPAMPRHVNVDALASAAARERSGRR